MTYSYKSDPNIQKALRTKHPHKVKKSAAPPKGHNKRSLKVRPNG